MGYETPSGEYVRFYLESSTLNVATEVVMVDRNGNNRPLQTGERLIITNFMFGCGQTASGIQFYQDMDGSGAPNGNEILFTAYGPANATLPFRSDLGIHSMRKPAGTNGKFYLLQSAASNFTRIVITGYIVPS